MSAKVLPSITDSANQKRLARLVHDQHRRIGELESVVNALMDESDWFCDRDEACPACGNRLKHELVWNGEWEQIVCIRCDTMYGDAPSHLACPSCSTRDPSLFASPPQSMLDDLGIDEKAGLIACQNCGHEFRIEEV